MEILTSDTGTKINTVDSVYVLYS